ncbi:SAVMC3_10250 family protein [Streptomyces sp. NPDC051243]|uniref:SAVMC3_10250 family protein n=1 Tax=Streptomyces sp. NPDC051243 TaxID=3365646 RepID=UPI0037AC1C18
MQARASTSIMSIAGGVNGCTPRSVVRELVYLSHGKLRQFLPERRLRAPRAKWQLSTPVGGVGWEPEALDVERARNERLHQVVEHVSASARWFTEGDLRAGSWVQFEAPLNYLMLRGPLAPDMVLFVDPPRPVEGYETGGRVRLVLHGSARHLVGSQNPVVAEPPPLDMEQLGALGGSIGGSFGRLVLPPAASLLTNLAGEPAVTSDLPRLGDPEGWREVRTLADGTCQLLTTLDGQLPAETAAWMCGFARITAVIDAPPSSESATYVVGTPLYVEFAAD